MSYQPIIPTSGISGWRFLQRTSEKQQSAFEKSADLKREMDYFRENITSVKTVDDLMGNRKLLKTALTAFGLEGEINKKAFIRKALEEGTADGSFAARLSDPSWKNLSAAFGFGDGGAKTATAGFADTILSGFKTRSYEAAVGKADDSMRLALNFKREIAALAAKNDGKGGSWYSILGSKSLRKVVEGAFGLPTSFSQIDIDQQVEILKDKTSAKYGSDSLSVFQDTTVVERMIDTYLVRKQLTDGISTSSSTATSGALTLLQSANGSGSDSNGIANLLSSFYKK